MTDKGRRQRLRLEDLRHHSTQDGRCRVEVRLEWCGVFHSGIEEGLETQQGRLRAATLAALTAVGAAGGEALELELAGVKAVRAFDGWVVVAAVRGTSHGERLRLLGSASCDDEERIERSAALAVLDATNRVVERLAPC